MLGMSTGLPLYVVGTSTYGATGGLFMPGLLMGLLQFGWLAVNAFFVSILLCKCFDLDYTAPGWPHGIIASAFIILAAFVGLKGIKYVGRVGTYLPLIPIAVLLILLAYTHSGLSKINRHDTLYPQMARPVEGTGESPAAYEQQMKVFEHQQADLKSRPPQFDGRWQIIGIICTYVVGFFATAGAAGADIAMSSRSKEDVHIGGVTGILLPTVLAGGAALFIVAGAYGSDMVQGVNVGNYNPVDLMPMILGKNFANILFIGLAISAFPGACFASFIAANSFKTTMPKVNPFVSVGFGALAAIILAVTGIVGSVIWVFQVIGASFGPVCGAMLADYLMSGRKWSGPRAGFNPAGWISWLVGFFFGAFNLVVTLLLQWPWAVAHLSFLHAYQGEPYVDTVPVPPITAFVIGFALYVLLSVIGARTRKLEMPEVAQ